ncbi:MAG: CASTOR/POLLUX-related putative ion channel, partial [Acidimicrobiales bacterium]
MTSSPESKSRRLPLRSRIRYRFDNLLARGTWAPLLLLGVITLVAVFLSSLLLAASGVSFAGSENDTFIEDIWQSVLRIIDPGTMADDVGWGRRVLAILVTFVGILVAGTLIGLIASGIEQRVAELRRGRSQVAEEGHVVILGASSRLPIVVEQLALAGRARGGSVIVVLADGDLEAAQDEVRATVPDLYRSRLVFRYGDSTRISELAIANVAGARSIIVLGNDDGESDADAVKTVLAAGAVVGGFDRVPIVVDLETPETGRSLVRACGPAVYPLAGTQAMARITAFTLREGGLSQVISELLDLRGCDIHVHEPMLQIEQTFGELVVSLDKIRPIGRITVGGDVEINPEPQTRLNPGDRLVVIADDQALTIDVERSNAVPVQRRIPGLVMDEPQLEHLLVLGWNALGAQLIAQLERNSEPGSSVRIAYDRNIIDPATFDLPKTRRIDVETVELDRPTLRQSSELLSDGLTSVVVLGYRRSLSVEQADSATLLNLMLLRREFETWDGRPPRVVAELLNADNVELARVTGADDFVVSDAVASRLIAQMAEQPERRLVLQNLYSGEDSGIHLVGSEELGLVGSRRFQDIVTTAYAAGLLAIGWRRGPAH